MTLIPTIGSWINSRKYEMHYKNGREAKLGDIVSAQQYGKRIYGILLKIYEGATTCSGIISTTLSLIPFAGSAVILPALNDPWGSGSSTTVTLQDCLHIEDLISSLETVQTISGDQIPTL